MPNVVITQNGLNYVTSAATGGIHIDIKYFLPVFDYRYAPEYHDGVRTSAIPLSAGATSGDTLPTGEIIYNIDGENNAYSLSPTDDFVIYTNTETITNSASTPWRITGAPQSKVSQINLYNRIPLVSQISGSDVFLSAVNNTIVVNDGSLVIGNNSVPPATSASFKRYFGIVDYAPVLSGSTVRGSVKCRLTGKYGTFKFNKIALYCLAIDDGTGLPVSNTPVLFGEAMIENTIVKTDFGVNTQGFDDVVIDVQIQLQSVNATWENVFYSTSGDYWELTPNGLYYPENVGIGLFSDSLPTPMAKLHIKSTTEAQLRLGYDDTNLSELYTTSSGNLQINLLSNSSIIPSATNSNSIGTSTYAWKNMYSYNFKTAAGNNFLDTGLNLMADTIIMFVDNENKYNTVWNADIARYQEDEIFYTDQNISTSAKNLYLIAGASNVSSFYTDVASITGQTGLTHKNLIAKLNTNSFTNLNGLSSINLIAAGGIKTYGNIVPLLNETNSIGSIDKAYNYSFVNIVLCKNLGYYGNVENINLGASLIPVTDNTYDLGGNLGQFDNHYFKSMATHRLYVANYIDTYNGVCEHYRTDSNGDPLLMGKWDTFAPQWTGYTPSNVEAKYMRIGNSLFMYINFIYFNPNTNQIYFTLPYALINNSANVNNLNTFPAYHSVPATVVNVNLNPTSQRLYFSTVSGGNFSGRGIISALIVYETA
jgi:hypothetical protein